MVRTELPVFSPHWALFLFTSKTLRHGQGWLLLSLGLSTSPVAIVCGSEQVCLVSAGLKSWHWHNTEGQETGAGSMWYLVSVIFCNTYVLPVEMAEASIFVSHLIHLASPCCVSVWIKMELCTLGPIISEALPVFDRSGHLQSAPSSMQITYPAWLSASGFYIPHNKSVSVATKKIHAITFLCFLFEKYTVPFFLN